MSLHLGRYISVIFNRLPPRLLAWSNMLAGIVLIIFLFVSLLAILAFRWPFLRVRFFRRCLLFRSFLHLLPRDDAEEVRQFVRLTARWVNALVERVLMVELLFLWVLLLQTSAVVVRAEHNFKLL